MKQEKKGSSLSLQKYIVPVSIGGLLLLFLVLTLVNFFYEQPIHTAGKIAQDIQQLAKIFASIDKECGIISFDYANNPINFLTIKKDGFIGSEVGSMNLAHPEKWQGPYVAKNLHIQAK